MLIYGSGACGDARKDSDLNVLLLVKDAAGHLKSREFIERIRQYLLTKGLTEKELERKHGNA